MFGSPSASSGTPAPARGPAPATPRTASRAEVQAVARQMGISEDEARRRLEAQGVQVE